MSNEFVMYMRAKGSEAALTGLKSDVLRHCTVLNQAMSDSGVPDYRVDLAAWNPRREDWAEDRLPRWLECRKGHSELLPIKDGELKAKAGGRKAAPLHFLDGLRDLYPDLELSAYAIDLSNGAAEDWRCSSEGTFCVEEVMSCWEGEEVLYWKKKDRLMIDHGKPVAEELLKFAGKPFVMVEGVPLSITLDAAKDFVRKEIQKGRDYLAYLLDDGALLDGRRQSHSQCAESGPTAPSGAGTPENDFFGSLKRMQRAESGSKETP